MDDLGAAQQQVVTAELPVEPPRLSGRLGEGATAGQRPRIALCGLQDADRGMVEPGEELVSYSLRVGDQVVPFRRVDFRPSLPAGDTTRLSDAATLRLAGTLNGLEIELAYTFAPGDYLVWVEGQVSGLGAADATLLLGLGPRLAVNEADSAEDLRLLSYVTYSRRYGIESVRITNLDRDRVEEGPLAWAALLCGLGAARADLGDADRDLAMGRRGQPDGPPVPRVGRSPGTSMVLSGCLAEGIPCVGLALALGVSLGREEGVAAR
jgi:hypothetical protein